MAEEPRREDRAREAIQEAEQRTASAMEQLVQSNAFGELLARSTENVMGLTRIGFDTLDLVIRNLRIAGRRDVARLGRQLSRTEDKLERVLQEVEELRDDLRREREARGTGADGRSASSRRRSQSTSRSASSSSRGNRSSNGRKSSSGSRSKSS